MGKNATRKALRTFAAKVEAKYAKEIFDEAQAGLVEAMHEEGEEKFTIDTPEGDVKVALVENERMILDEDALRSRLGEDVWDTITKTVLDKDLLEARIATGEIDTSDVSACAEWRPNKAFVKFTVVK